VAKESYFNPCAVIPVYNHERTIAAVLDSVRKQGLPVVLVDDGCSELCSRELERLSSLPQVWLLKHTVNQGKGAAVRTGLLAAGERGFTHALQIDADGQHSLQDIRRFIDEARVHPDTIICGRPVFDATIPRARLYGRYFSHVFVWTETLSLDIVDSMCGFRVYPLKHTLPLLRKSHIRSRMDFDTEILVRLHWREVPMRWLKTAVHYPLDGVSHFRMWRDNVLMVTLHTRLLCGMLIRLPLLLSLKLRNVFSSRRAPLAKGGAADVHRR
jgi:glycosyltransferase involved in cell wall biosynthesis